MTAIHIKFPSLALKAGPRAFARIRANGLPDDNSHSSKKERIGETGHWSVFSRITKRKLLNSPPAHIAAAIAT